MISLIFPSRGRPIQARNTLNSWMEQAGANGDIECVISLDSDDPFINDYLLWCQSSHIIVSPNTSVVEAVNKAAAKSRGSILMYLSDDFQCFPFWAEVIERLVNRYKGEFLIKVNDGLQRFDNDLVTIPIMSRELYQGLGYFFHPAYKSMYVDTDLFHTCKRRGVIKFHPEITFRHLHPSNGTAPYDPTYKRTHDNYPQGKEVFERRKKQRFK